MKGHDIICVDIDKSRVDAVNRGEPKIYEEGIKESLKKVMNKKLRATTDGEKAVVATEISFICVGTPDRNGRQDLSYVRKASEDVGRALRKKKKYHLIVVKSTVLPKTTEEVVLPLLEKASGRKCGADFGVCVNPEFLREGKALEDFLEPDRIVIGEYDSRSGDILERLYKGFNAPIMRTNMNTAEMIKYASNVFLASKVTLINEIGNICKALGIDVYKVAEGMGHDKRISPYFLNAGAGFGGSCFAKDAAAIIDKSQQLGYEPKLLKTMLAVNEDQKRLIIKQVESRLKGLKGKKIAVLGLAFKPGTDDIRDSTAIVVIEELLKRKAVVNAYDPKAESNMKKIYTEVNYFPSAASAMKGADACLILTEWPEFNKLSDKDFSLMRQKIIIEGRRILDRKKVHNFHGICW